MQIDVVTLFPPMFQGPLSESMVKRAQEKGIAQIRLHNLRDFTDDKHQTADDKPYGGGSGMVMMVEPIAQALDQVARPGATIVVATPRGEKFTQAMAEELARRESLVFVCGHYEGVDERVFELFPCREVSIGDFVLTNGELPAMVMIDAIVRLLPGVLGNAGSLEHESFQEGLLEYPQYTRPADFRGKKVPEVLLSGNHAEIARWRKEKRLELTRKRRPDLLTKRNSK